MGFEQFFLHFLNAGISLAVDRGGERIERKVIEAITYAAGTGRNQKGIDLLAKMEGGETWAFQCKRRKTWDVGATGKAVEDATYPAQHYFLLVACDPHQDVQDLMAQYANWSFWNLDRICQEVRMRVPKPMLPRILHFLAPEELARFAPFATDALVPAMEYFAPMSRPGHSFHHDHPLIGRRRELAALHAFAGDPRAKVLKLSAKGGEGKSRLLKEFAGTVPQEGQPEVLFLNPHATGDLTLALWEQDVPRVLVVDDAHRLDRVSAELLALVRNGSATKLLLAMRPQGREAVDERLRDQGFTEVPTIELQALKEKDSVALAEEALGPGHKEHAGELAARTGSSPFLTVLAGNLIRRGTLRWAGWHSDDAFRAEVFRWFERENLEPLDETRRGPAERLLRLIALLEPVNPDEPFHQRGADCLEIPKVEVEALLHGLQATGVVSPEPGNIRVIPDLFADFLVFETVFDPLRRLPQFARTVLKLFVEDSTKLLRNLAEASWVASAQAIPHNDLIRPLLDHEFARFDAADGWERLRMIHEWSAFSVYLPAESLELARRALGRKTPPVELNGASTDRDGHYDVTLRDGVLAGLPALLKPVALWHDAQRHEALDVLWTLGLDAPRGAAQGGENHPWSVISEVVGFSSRKPLHVSKEAVGWVAGLARRPSVRKVMESNRSVLGTLLGPCFARYVESSEWHGRTVRWHQCEVNIEATAPVRTRAREILAELINQDSWRLALDAVRAAERAFQRTAGLEVAWMKDPKAFLTSWLPERELALGLLTTALARHSHPMVHWTVRQMLQCALAREEDEAFGAKLRDVLAAVRDDLDLQLLGVILSDGYVELREEPGAPKGEARNETMARWEERIGRVVDALVAARPTATEAVEYLDGLVAESLEAGYFPRLGELLPVLARRHPELAGAMVPAFHASGRIPEIAVAWYHLLFGLTDEPGRVWPLLREAASHPRTEVRRGVVDYLRFRDRKEVVITPDEQLLLEEMAGSAGTDEMLALVRLVQWAGESCAEWGFRLLGRLRLAEMTEAQHGEVLAALNPYGVKRVAPPEATVRHVLNALVAVPEIIADHEGGGFQRAVELYPRVVYDFVLQRIAVGERLTPEAGYRPLPCPGLGRFRLPGLDRAPDFPAICEFLWQKVSSPTVSSPHNAWCQLFQAVVLDHIEFWLPRLIEAIRSAPTIEDLRNWLNLICFDGSLVIFRFPELTSAALLRAEDLDGTVGSRRIRAALYHVTGPSVRGFTDGELNRDSDYVEAEAIRAAATHAKDPVLGPFFRWIMAVEQGDREDERRRHILEM